MFKHPINREQMENEYMNTEYNLYGTCKGVSWVIQLVNNNPTSY